jgi:hypothetical protein
MVSTIFCSFDVEEQWHPQIFMLLLLTATNIRQPSSEALKMGCIKMYYEDQRACVVSAEMPASN